MKQGSVIRSNRSQFIRLPKSVALPENVIRVDIVAIGHTLIISPADETWDNWFDAECVSPDFMGLRDQPANQVRDRF